MSGQKTALVKQHPGSWTKGQSGNPGGRPRSEHDVSAMCRALTPRIVAALDQALDDPRSRVASATILLERGWGKVPQPVDASSAGQELTLLHLIAARQVAEQMQALAESGIDVPKHARKTPAPIIDLSEPALE